MAMYNVSNAKLVKELGKNIFLTSCRHFDAMVHYITVYITSSESSETNEQLRNILWILFVLGKLRAMKSI